MWHAVPCLLQSWDQLSHILLLSLSTYAVLVRTKFLYAMIWLFIGLSLDCHWLFWINVVTHLYDFLSSQLVIWGTDVGDLHLRGLPVPWHSCWGAVQVAQRGTSHGQAWQLHQRAVRIFPSFSQNFHQIRDSHSSWAALLCLRSCNQLQSVNNSVLRHYVL